MCPQPAPATLRAPPIGPVPKTWVLTWYQNYRSWRQLRVHAATDSTQHLFMAWQRHEPIKKLIFKVVRGVIVNCGWVWVWDNPFILEQWEYGDSFYHTFRIDSLHPADHVWYYLFTPLGPYDLQCQGPLVHVPPPETLPWARSVIVGTQTKGIYRTNNFSGPGDPQPFWLPQNLGLTDLRVWQLCGDPVDPAYRHYAIVGPPTARVLYRKQPYTDPAWHPILNHSQALDLTHSTGGVMRWVSCNWNRPGFVYVLWSSTAGDNGIWLLRSSNDGDSWTAIQTQGPLGIMNVGNLSIGVMQGSSPYEPGDVLYHTYTSTISFRQRIKASFDNGDTWQLRESLGFSGATSRCYVDPTNQGSVYMGAANVGYSMRYLYRSIEHGAGMNDCGNGRTLATLIAPYPAQMWVHPTNPLIVKLLVDRHVWQTWDYGTTWEDMGDCGLPLVRLSILPNRLDYLYMARDSSAPGPGDPGTGHVLFVSEDNGATLYGKSGFNCNQSTGGGDSIPFDCGGVCQDGIMHTV